MAFDHKAQLVVEASLAAVRSIERAMNREDPVERSVNSGFEYAAHTLDKAALA